MMTKVIPTKKFKKVTKVPMSQLSREGGDLLGLLHTWWDSYMNFKKTKSPKSSALNWIRRWSPLLHAMPKHRWRKN